MDLRDQLQSTLGTAYTIQEELGGGGMSRVFIAEERALGRRVVVKVLPPELSGDVNIDRFRREIRLAARLQHPHIVPVLTAGELGGIPYYTMPYEQGCSLRGQLVDAGPLSIADATAILGDVAKALAYAHSQGVVHRDIKPDNVLVCGDAAVVTDFGIAKALSDSTQHVTQRSSGATLTQVGMTMGTPAYMAPEQAAADPAMDHRADIYAFGCLAYELLTGRPPFTYTTPQKLLAAHLTEVPTPVDSIRLDTPAPLSVLVMQCLQKEPGSRPQHAGDMVRTFDALSSGQFSAARPTPTPRQRLGRALLWYGVAFIPVAIVAKATIITLDLPQWVLVVVMTAMVLALPLVMRRA